MALVPDCSALQRALPAVARGISPLVATLTPRTHRTLYVAGPMRGKAWCNFPAFDAAAALLRARGFDVLSPADHDREQGFEPDETGLDLSGWDLREALTWDVAAVARSDGVVLLPEWRGSKGVALELACARALGLPLFELAQDGSLTELREQPVLVGISGYARSGKDTLADALACHHGFARIAFADKVRELTLALSDGTTELVSRLGWEEAKTVPAVRRRLQDVGLAVRTVLGEDSWVAAALNDLDPAGRYVISDVRFKNEAVTLRERGGVLVRIVRPGVGPVNDHPSERDLDDWTDWDFVVRNDGTLDDLVDEAARIACMAG